MLIPDLGWRTIITNIMITTIQGNKSTTPRGIEMFELRRNRSGRLKKAHLGDTFLAFFLTSSSDGMLGDGGKRFITLCTKPIETVVLVVPLDRGVLLPQAVAAGSGPAGILY
jgi:hypothetical protein